MGRIGDVRVSAALDVVALHEHGLSPEEIRSSYEHLTLGQIHSALAFSYDHPDELMRDEERSRAVEEEFRRDHPDLCR